MTSWRFLLFEIDWSAVAQMLTACAAIGALIVGPKLAFANEQRSRIASSRQMWLDALRNEVSELVAVHTRVLAARTMNIPPNDGFSTYDIVNMTSRVDQIAQQVRFRLNISRPDQLALHNAVVDFCCCSTLQEAQNMRAAISTTMDALNAKVWWQIKTGAVN